MNITYAVQVSSKLTSDGLKIFILSEKCFAVLAVH